MRTGAASSDWSLESPGRNMYTNFGQPSQGGAQDARTPLTVKGLRGVTFTPR